MTYVTFHLDWTSTSRRLANDLCLYNVFVLLMNLYLHAAAYDNAIDYNIEREWPATAAGNCIFSKRRGTTASAMYANHGQ